MAQVGAAALPVMVALILLVGFAKGVPVFDVFLTGAKEGLRTSLNLLPTLIGMIAAVTMLRASGLLEALCTLLQPLAAAVGVSPELLPLALLRPISGSGASAYTLDLFRQFGQIRRLSARFQIAQAAQGPDFGAGIQKEFAKPPQN